MKKISVLLTAFVISLVATYSFAAVKIGSAPNEPSNGNYYIGKIVAAN